MKIKNRYCLSCLTPGIIMQINIYNQIEEWNIKLRGFAFGKYGILPSANRITLLFRAVAERKAATSGLSILESYEETFEDLLDYLSDDLTDDKIEEIKVISRDIFDYRDSALRRYDWFDTEEDGMPPCVRLDIPNISISLYVQIEKENPDWIFPILKGDICYGHFDYERGNWFIKIDRAYGEFIYLEYDTKYIKKWSPVI